MPDPYRTTYRVEHRVRALSPEEDAWVRARRDAWTERAFPPLPRALGAGLALAFAIAALALWRDHPALGFAIATPTLVVTLCFVLGERRRRRDLARAHGPWHAPEGGWSIRETHVFARSIVGAASDDEDYVSWALFEIPGGEWLFLDLLTLPEGSPERELAREHVTFVRLWPDGQMLDVKTEGSPIPVHTALAMDGDGYAETVERGWVWRPPSEYDEPRPDGASLARAREDRVAESELPEWVRTLTRA